MRDYYYKNGRRTMGGGDNDMRIATFGVYPTTGSWTNEEPGPAVAPTKNVEPLPDNGDSGKSDFDDDLRRWWLEYLSDWFENIDDPLDSNLWEAGRVAWLMSVLDSGADPEMHAWAGLAARARRAWGEAERWGWRVGLPGADKTGRGDSPDGGTAPDKPGTLATPRPDGDAEDRAAHYGYRYGTVQERKKWAKAVRRVARSLTTEDTDVGFRRGFSVARTLFRDRLLKEMYYDTLL